MDRENAERSGGGRLTFTTKTQKDIHHRDTKTQRRRFSPLIYPSDFSQRCKDARPGAPTVPNCSIALWFALRWAGSKGFSARVSALLYGSIALLF